MSGAPIDQIGKIGVGTRIYRIFCYFVLLVLAVMSLFPFFTMFINATRHTGDIERNAFSFIPSTYVAENWKQFSGGNFNPILGFKNSVTIAVGATLCAIYFSALTAYSIVVYDWKLRNAFFGFILAVMMIPAQVTTIGFYRFMWSIGMTNSFLPLILPAMASPAIVFFMRQYLLATFPLDIVNSARIDGASEFRIFNQIALSMMRPALATQAIFVFVGSWNSLFMPMILLIDNKLHTMPIIVSLLRNDFYRTNYGAVYLAISVSVLPLFVVYFSLSKYIIAGVQLGGVKE